MIFQDSITKYLQPCVLLDAASHMARSLTSSPEKRPSVKVTGAANKARGPQCRTVAPSKSPSKSSSRPAAKRRRLNGGGDADAHLPLVHANGLPRQTNGDVKTSKSLPTQSHSPQSKLTNHGMPVAASATGSSSKKAASPAEDKRSLRSKDNVPPKSDLEKYFPDYQEVVFGGKEDEEFLPPETVIHIIDDPPTSLSLPLRTHPSPATAKRKRSAPPSPNTTRSQNADSPSGPSRGPARKERDLDLKALADQWARTSEDPSKDPLSDEPFKQTHKRAERKEKQSRNTDRERAMHEKSELERLLGDLKGPDWLRTLGISGITETQKRQLEPKRDEFIRRVKGLLARFAAWKAKEKKLKEKRDRRLARLQAEEDEEEEEPEEGQAAEEEDKAEDGGEDEGVDASIDRAGEHPREVNDPPSDSPIEIKRRLPPQRKSAPKKESPDSPFSSFFAKAHLRAAALGKHRRGRHVFAFGHPVPELAEADFSLPSDLH